MSKSTREQIKQLIDDWVLSLADEYDNASDRVKQTLEENSASEEDWQAILDPIMSIIALKEKEARLGLVDYFDQVPSNDLMDWKNLFADTRRLLEEGNL